MDSLISNSILNITTNCKIDQKKYVECFGGNFSHILPAARRIVIINGLRYTFLIHSTGKIILSNFHFSYNLSDLFSWIISMILEMVQKKVAVLRNDDCDQSEQNNNDSSITKSFEEKNTKKKKSTNRILIKFLVENICCATNIKTTNRYSQSKLETNQNISFKEAINLNSQIDNLFLKEFINNVRDMDNVIDVYMLKRTKFPALIIKIKIKRNWNGLWHYKSDASIKRKMVDFNNLAKQNQKIQKKNRLDAKIQKMIKDNLNIDRFFNTQKCTVELFMNGQVIITGSQTKQDFLNIMNILSLLFSSLF